jgi:magnesium chelatase family protein
VTALTYAEMERPGGEASAVIAERIRLAREIQSRRGPGTNGDMPSPQLRSVAAPDRDGRRLLALAMDRLGLTGRAHDRLLRVARTLADLEAADSVAGRHVAEALQFRGHTAATEGCTDLRLFGDRG